MPKIYAVGYLHPMIILELLRRTDITLLAIPHEDVARDAKKSVEGKTFYLSDDDIDVLAEGELAPHVTVSSPRVNADMLAKLDNLFYVDKVPDFIEAFCLSPHMDYIDVSPEIELAPRAEVPSQREAFYPSKKWKNYKNPIVPKQRHIIKRP